LNLEEFIPQYYSFLAVDEISFIIIICSSDSECHIAVTLNTAHIFFDLIAQKNLL